MAKDEMHKFLEYKAASLDNLVALSVNLIECKDYGYEDMEDMLYNEILDLEDEVKASDSNLELSDVIQKAKTIENKLDYFYETKGISTMSLTWPDI